MMLHLAPHALLLLLGPSLVTAWSLDPKKEDGKLTPKFEAKETFHTMHDAESEKMVTKDGGHEVSAAACNWDSFNPAAHDCNDSCDEWKTGSCDDWCDHGCDNACNSSCDWNGCDGSCDANCDDSCNLGCDSNPTRGCDHSCDKGCTPNSVSTSFDVDLECPIYSRGESEVMAQQVTKRGDKEVVATAVKAADVVHVKDLKEMRVHVLSYKPGDALPIGLRFHNESSKVEAMASCSVSASLVLSGTITITAKVHPNEADISWPVHTGVQIDASCEHAFTIEKTLEKMLYSSGAYKVEGAFGMSATFESGVSGMLKPYVNGQINAKVSGSGPSGSATFSKPGIEKDFSAPSATVKFELTAGLIGSIGPNIPYIGEVEIAKFAGNAIIESPEIALSGSGLTISGGKATVDIEGEVGVSGSVSFTVGGSLGSACGQTVGFEEDITLSAGVSLGHSKTIYDRTIY